MPGGSGSDIATLGQGLRAGDLSAEALCADALARARASAPAHVFLALDPTGAEIAARASDQRLRAARPLGPLDGIALGVKDNIAAEAMPWTGGSPAFARLMPDGDAGALARLRAAGMVVLGKTNLHELAFGISSANAWSGAVANPADPTRIAGGSSGGSAAAVAAGIVPAALGTDTGGSGRIPAALCGCTGFRPTTDRYPDDGVMMLSTTRDTVSVMGRTVADIALLDAVLAGTGAPAPGPALSLAGRRVGVPRRHFLDDLSPEVAAATADALAALEAAGAVLVDVDADALVTLDRAIGLPIVVAEAQALWRDFLARRLDADLDWLVARIASPDVAGIFAMIAGVPDDPAGRAALGRDLERLRAAGAALFADAGVEATVFPTVPVTAPPIADGNTITLNGTGRDLFATMIARTSPGTLAALPGITLPLARAAGDLPIGLSLDAPRGSDAALLDLAAAVARTLGSTAWMPASI